MSVLLQGYVVPLALGVVLRQTFTVPTPSGETAPSSGGAPYLGSLEQPIAFALDFRPWLDGSETLASQTATVRAYPWVPSSTRPPADATASLLAAAAVQDSLAIVTLHGAQPQTSYVVTVSATTTLGRTLECRLPRIQCPD